MVKKKEYSPENQSSPSIAFPLDDSGWNFCVCASKERTGRSDKYYIKRFEWTFGRMENGERKCLVNVSGDR